MITYTGLLKPFLKQVISIMADKGFITQEDAFSAIKDIENTTEEEMRDMYTEIYTGGDTDDE